MTTQRRAATLAVAGTVGALLLAACGGSGGNNSTTSASGSASGGAAGFDAASTTVVNPSDATGGTLNLGASGDCDSWDPARTYYAWCWDMQRLISRGLTAYSPAVGVEGTKAVPDLAAGPAEVSADKKTWTYKLQDGLKWQDGSAVTSADVKYAIKRLYATDVINGGPTFYYLDLLDANYGKAGAYEGPYKDPKGDLPSITTPDDKTITFQLVRPFADFDYLMATPAAAPVQQSKDKGDQYGQKVQSTGPFMISDYQAGKSITFVKNPNWAADTDKVRSPKVDKINLTIFANPDDMDKRLEAGTIDLIADGGVQQAFQSKILTNPQLKENADNPTTGFTRYLVVFQQVIPNLACREAIFYAINKSDLQLARGGDAGGQIAGSMTPGQIPGYDEAYDPYPVGPDSTGDLEMAKKKLAECGKPNGFDVNMAYVAAGRGIPIFEGTQAALKRVGINVKPAASEQSVYYSTFIGSPANIKAKQLGLGIAGWGPDFPSIYGFWNSIANGAAILPTGNSNYAELDDPVVNKALDEAAVTTDDAKRTELGKTVNEGVMKNAVMLPFVWDKALYYRSPRLTNVVLNRGLGSYYDYVNLGVSDGK